MHTDKHRKPIKSGINNECFTYGYWILGFSTPLRTIVELSCAVMLLNNLPLRRGVWRPDYSHASYYKTDASDIHDIIFLTTVVLYLIIVLSAWSHLYGVEEAVHIPPKELSTHWTVIS